MFNLASPSLGANRVSLLSDIIVHMLRIFLSSRQAKIALKATSEDQLLELEAIAKSLNLCARSILDA